MSLKNVSIVLVLTSHGGNIGAVARAMANMGLSDLRLVNPVRFPGPEATARAVGAIHVLESAQIFETLDEAIADSVFVAGATARLRSIPWRCAEPHSAMTEVAEVCREKKVALIFGREASGLTNEELDRAQLHVRIPVAEEYTSLNLAAAVLILSYELRRAYMTGRSEEGSNQNIDSRLPLASAEQIQGFFEHLEVVLRNIGFLQQPSAKLLRKIKRIFSRAPLQEQEVNILRGILSAIEQKDGQSLSR